MKILVLENSDFIQVGITEQLPQAEVRVAPDFGLMKDSLAEGSFDCLILDDSLLGQIPAQPIAEIKHINRHIGLIVTSGENLLSKRIEALAAGADDYLTQPFDFSELAARMVALDRRVNLAKEDDLIFDEIRIDMNAKTVYVNGTELDLTKKELELLGYFIGHRNSVVTKENLISHLSGETRDFKEATDLIYAHIKNLKKKLRTAGSADYLQTIYGVGYKWGRR